MNQLPLLRDVGEIRYAGIALWKQQDGSYSTLMFPEDNLPKTEQSVPSKFSHVRELTDSICSALSCLGGVRVAMVKKVPGHEHKVNGIVIDKNAPGPEQQFHYAPFIPLSPTVGVVAHHLFLAAYPDAELVVKSIVVNRTMNPLCAEKVDQDLGTECCDADVLDPSLVLWNTQDEDLFRWETPNDFQFLQLCKPLFTEFFTPLPCFNIPDFTERVPAQLINLGFATTPYTGEHIGKLRYWIEYFPTDFHQKVQNEEEEKLLSNANKRNPLKIDSPSILKKILEERIKFIQHVIAHRCVSIGEYSEYNEADPKAPNFCARISMWPGLSGGPSIPLNLDFLVNRQFLGLASGSRAGYSDNIMVSVNNLAFANGYKIFVVPSFANVPTIASQYIDQFQGLAGSLDEITANSNKRRRLLGDDDGDSDN